MKKNLKAFLNKNKSKAAPTKGDNAATADETATQKANDVQVANAQKAEKKETSQAKHGDSSDEEVEDDIDLNVQFGNIKENKDVAPDTKQETKANFGYEDSVITRNPVNDKKDDAKKFGGGTISFGGGRPMFQNKKKGGITGDFEAGLDDLDDDGNVKTKSKNQRKAGTAADGGKEWVNLGSSARVRRNDEDSKETEVQEKKEVRKPTFTGKMNLRNTGDAGEKDDGPKHAYDFGVKFRGADDDKKPREGPKDQGERKHQKNRGDKKGIQFDDFMKNKNNQNVEDGFEVVTDSKKQRQRRHKRNDSSSEEEDNAKAFARPSRK